LLLACQAVIYPVATFFNLSLANNNWTPVIYPIVYMTLSCSVLFAVTLGYIKERKKQSNGNSQIVKSKAKTPYIRMVFGGLTLLIITITLWRCLMPTDSVITFLVNNYRGNYNFSNDSAQMKDITNQFVNEYDGKTIAFWSASANKYLAIENYNYTDIGPICAISDIITDKAEFIVKKAPDDGYVMLCFGQH